MIPYINDRMNRWAEWRLRGRFHNGLGYPAVSISVRLEPGGAPVRSPDFDDECFDVESAFCALQVVNADLAAVLFLFHCRAMNLTVAQMARDASCSRDTFYARVQRGHQAILGYLNDIAAGVPLPRPDLRASDAGTAKMVVDKAPTLSA